MTSLATATQLNWFKGASQDTVVKKTVKKDNSSLAKIASALDQINELDWKTIDTLIDNKETILADKKVIVNGKEINKDYVFKLIGSLSRINWEELHQLLSVHKSSVANALSKQGKSPSAVADVLKRTELMKEIDWKNYFKSFGM